MVCVMTRLNVYLPDDLAAQVRDADINVSAVTQQALRQALAARSADTWLSSLPAAPAARIGHDAAIEALDAARDEAPTRHG